LDQAKIKGNTAKVVEETTEVTSTIEAVTVQTTI
jgi:hypothetical protein